MIFEYNVNSREDKFGWMVYKFEQIGNDIHLSINEQKMDVWQNVSLDRKGIEKVLKGWNCKYKKLA